ncbi:MAG: hypothetical protein UR66_C0005G0091 [Candidatus Moranbacteria bacterium GW2011_GWE1_35_17]|nr:MAG: hypothetical protein UR66_C0005G0091 [Candidatus Moranbacteria bacterium GW2011_GWE1_35_17]KKP81517.1 MAG: hypothetical protein UR82_C0059G0006 [Candidatus Moranbacteria bacterium GW2011_GWF1_35_5]
MGRVIMLGDFALKREREKAYQELVDFFKNSGLQQCAWELKSTLRSNTSGLVFTNFQAESIVKKLSYKFKITQAELEHFATKEAVSGWASAQAKVIVLRRTKQGCDDEEFLNKLDAAIENGLFENSDALQMICDIIRYYPRAKAVIWKRK